MRINETSSVCTVAGTFQVPLLRLSDTVHPSTAAQKKSPGGNRGQMRIIELNNHVIRHETV